MSFADFDRSEPAFRPFTALGDVAAEPDWLWRGYLSPGALTLLAGHPFAGKSMLVGGLLRGLRDGSSFLGLETSRATALLVSEEDDGVLRQRSELLGLLDLGGAYISRSSGVTRWPWPQLVQAAQEQALRDGHGLLVIDTFPGLAQLGDEQENDAGAIGERLRPLQTAASHGLAVLFLHHMNGYGQPRGSKAFRGVVDIMICFHREKNCRFRLEAESRYPIATPPRLRGTLVKGPGLWFYETESSGRTVATDPGQAETDALLRKALTAAGPKGLTYAEVDDLPGLSSHKAKRRFPDWYANDKTIDRSGNGTKGDPFSWYVPAA